MRDIDELCARIQEARRAYLFQEAVARADRSRLSAKQARRALKRLRKLQGVLLSTARGWNE